MTLQNYMNLVTLRDYLSLRIETWKVISILAHAAPLTVFVPVEGGWIKIIIDERMTAKLEEVNNE